MFFSIIVPIYNIEKYVSRCIESLLEQDFDDYEILLVDDGSTDNSLSICKQYEKDKRIKILHKENGGLVSARKHGAKYATGEYIINVDGDDYIRPNCLNGLVSLLKQNKPDVALFSYEKVNGNVVFRVNNQINEGFYDDMDMVSSKFLFDKEQKTLNSGLLNFSIWSKIVKRELYQKCQAMVSDKVVQGEDIVLSFIIFEHAKNVLVSNLSYYYYLYRDNSLFNEITSKDVVRLKILIDELLSQTKDIHHNQIRVYLFYRFYELLYLRYKSIKNYKDFYNFAKEIEQQGLLNIIDECELIKGDRKTAVRFYFVKKRKYRLMYYFVKIKCR